MFGDDHERWTREYFIRSSTPWSIEGENGKRYEGRHAEPEGSIIFLDG